MKTREAVATVTSGRHLTPQEATAVMNEIMSGEATPAQIGAFLTALHLKGEQDIEIAAMAQVMRAHATPVLFDGKLVDTCGTGGDGSQSFNISTTAAFVVAGAGLAVAKHGNRAMSSTTGSADLLEALGVNIELDAVGVERCLTEAGIGFMFAQRFHPAMRFVAPVRREIGIRTIFNVLGPLTNPARARHQVLGVANLDLAEKLAHALSHMDIEHALVVHGDNGMDELNLSGPNTVFDVRSGQPPRRGIFDPVELGLERAGMQALRGGNPAENAAITRAILSGNDRGARHTVVVLNAGAALVAGDIVPNIAAGMRLAITSIETGKALASLERLIAVSNSV